MTPLDIMREAARLGLKAPHTERELAVGCIITDANGTILATGYSREDGEEKTHAEKVAIAKLPPDADTRTMDFYSTVEPCGTRLSHGPTCAHQVITRKFRRVYFAMHEPPHFVKQDGLGQIRNAGIPVEHLCDDGIAAMVARANPHIAW